MHPEDPPTEPAPSESTREHERTVDLTDGGPTSGLAGPSVSSNGPGPELRQDLPAAASRPEQEPASPTESQQLETLERDLAAVEEAMAGLDAIDADAMGGAAAAARVASIVDSDRFASNS